LSFKEKVVSLHRVFGYSDAFDIVTCCD